MPLLSRMLACGLAALVTCPAAVAAQHSRLEAEAAAEARKAARLEPQQLAAWERLAAAFLDGFVEPQGLGGGAGGIFAGGWLAVGPSYRRILDEETTFLARGLYSLRGYALVDVSVTSLGLARGRVDAHVLVRWFDANAVPFYGVGTTSVADDRATFGLRQGSVEGGLTVRPRRWLPLTLGVGHDRASTGGGRHGRSIETVFDAATVPGLGLDPRLIRLTGAAAVDTRTSAGYSRTGGLLRAEWLRVREIDGDADFDRVQLDGIRHLPLLRENIVISLRGRVQSIVDDDSHVPHFLLPALGGSHSLRGVPNLRFRDRHAVLVTGEYRWTPNRWAVDMAIFADAGQVAARRDALRLRDFDTDVGIGVRFHAPAATPLRIELARGGEGWRLVFATSPAF